MRGNLQRSGRNSWRIRFDLGVDPITKKRRIQSITIKGGRRVAEKRLSDMLSAHGSGTFVQPTKLSVGDHMKERIDHWEAAGEISSRTAERYRQLNDNQITPHLGMKQLQGVRTLDIEQWHVTLRTSGRKDGKGLSPRTIGHAHRVLGKGLRDAARHGLIMRNVTDRNGQRAPKVEVDEIEIIPADKISDVVAKLRGRALYPKIITALFTGLRRGEVLGLRWLHVDLKAKLIRVRDAIEETKAHGVRVKATKTKAGRRDISLPDIVVEALTEHRREQRELRLAMGIGKLDEASLVFPALDGTPARPSNLSGDWREAVSKLKLPDVSFHALRHTHASQLIDAGIDVVRISKRLGHASPNITLQVYAHLFRAKDIVSAEAINAALGSIGRA